MRSTNRWRFHRCLALLLCLACACILTVNSVKEVVLASSIRNATPTVTVGAFASVPASCVPGSQFVFSDAPWLVSAACVPVFVCVPPGTTTPANCQWEYLSRNGRVQLPPEAALWTDVNFDTSTKGDSVGTVQLVGSVTTAIGENQIRGLAITAPATPWTRTFYVRYYGQQQSLTLGMIVGFRESATDKSANFTVQKQAGATVFDSFNGYWDTSNDSSVTGFGTSWTGYQFDGNAGIIKVRIADNGTNLIIEVNPHGSFWVTLATVARTAHFTTAPDQFWWGVFTNSQSATSGVTATLFSLESQ